MIKKKHYLVESGWTPVQLRLNLKTLNPCLHRFNVRSGFDYLD